MGQAYKRRIMDYQLDQVGCFICNNIILCVSDLGRTIFIVMFGFLLFCSVLIQPTEIIHIHKLVVVVMVMVVEEVMVIVEGLEV